MTMSALSATSVFGSRRYEASYAASPALLRSLLVLGCVAATLVAAASGEPAAVLWRFGWQVPPGLAMAYIAATSALVGARVLIWQLSFIPLAAAVFHVAAFVVLVAAWRDRGGHHAR